jgi:hypothetical protein
VFDRERPAIHALNPSAGKPFTYGELIARDKTNLDITWLRAESFGRHG